MKAIYKGIKGRVISLDIHTEEDVHLLGDDITYRNYMGLADLTLLDDESCVIIDFNGIPMNDITLQF